MIVERHYDEDALIGIAQATEGLEEIRDPHLASCFSCADALESFRAISEVLRDQAAWDLNELRDDSSPESVARLREFASRSEQEHDEAKALLDKLLSEDWTTWIAAVSHDLRYQTAGVVREIIARSEVMIDTAPPDAVELGRVAITAADLVNEEFYDKDVVRRLRGAACRQYAYALFYVGEPHRALMQAARAERELQRCAVADYDLARVKVVRALVLQSLERNSEALPLTREAAAVFEAYGDRQRLASAYLAEAYLYMGAAQYRSALPILRNVEKMSSSVDGYTRASTAGNIALCLWQTGNLADAFASYQFAAAIYEGMGVRTEAARIRFNVAALLHAQGQQPEARRRLVALAEECRQLGMAYLTVAVELELAEILIEDSKLEEAERLCSDVLAFFQKAGISYAAGALTALAYLHEMAAHRRLTRETVRHVKKYVERLETQPQLLFAPPPTPVQ